MKREVKAKHGPPPYPPQLMAPPSDQSTVGQRGRIAALMTQAVRICQQHAATSLDSLGSLQNPVAVDEASISLPYFILSSPPYVYHRLFIILIVQ